MPNLRHNLIISASKEKVYEALTTEDGLRAWWTLETKADPSIGFVIHFKFGQEFFNKMEVTHLEPNSHVGWTCVGGDKEWIGTKLTFEMVDYKDGCMLIFSHLDWAHETEFFGFCNHHWGRYLDSLKSLCETGTGQPYAGN
jgi:uncharacterized protein YndB with AHSA1/START domain